GAPAAVPEIRNERDSSPTWAPELSAIFIASWESPVVEVHCSPRQVAQASTASQYWASASFAEPTDWSRQGTFVDCAQRATAWLPPPEGGWAAAHRKASAPPRPPPLPLPVFDESSRAQPGGRSEVASAASVSWPLVSTGGA